MATLDNMEFLDDYGRNAKSPSKKPRVADCGPCHVKLRCTRHSVNVDWPYAGFNLKGDLLAVTIPGHATAMEWNALFKKWSNEMRTSKPPFVQLNCPSLEFLRMRAMAQACENSNWCAQTHTHTHARTHARTRTRAHTHKKTGALGGKSSTRMAELSLAQLPISPTWTSTSRTRPSSTTT